MADNQLTTKDGKQVPGYLDSTAGQGGPAIVLIYEWWGLNAQIRGVADRYAKEGFNVFVPDLYRGKVATDSAGAERLMSSLDWGQAEADIRTAAQALRERLPGVKLGITGFCMGGAVALFCASRMADFAACVPFYGIPPKADLTQIRAKVMGHYATQDNWCTPDRVDEMERTMRAAGVSVEIHRYDAQHAFFNEKRPEVYSARDAELAWSRTVQFLRGTLG